jgi:hypothetical protein
MIVIISLGIGEEGEAEVQDEGKLGQWSGTECNQSDEFTLIVITSDATAYALMRSTVASAG